MNLLSQFQGVLGLALILGLAWALSENRAQRPSWRGMAGALAIQLVVAALIVRVPFIWDAMGLANRAVAAVERATLVGSSFMFGYLGGGELPFDLRPGAAAPVIVAFQVLPLVIVYSALAALLWHWGVLAAVVRGLSWALRKSMGVSGVVGLSAGSNLFLGVVESPLMLRAYFERLSRPELFAVMVLTMATISGAILILYAQTLSQAVPDAVGHMIAASVISLPAAILIARLMVPGGGATEARDEDSGLTYAGSADALIRGTMDGVQLFLAVIGVIVVVFSLVALVDGVLAVLPAVAEQPITLRRALGWLLAPFMWTLGVPWDQAGAAGALMGTKAVLNEYVAYVDLAALPAETFDARSRLIVVYALCGVANLASIGLLVATIGTLAPSRRAEAAGLGVRSWIAGNLASAMTGAVIGMVTATA
jgi:CNT family concentrative nucleoside transporter